MVVARVWTELTGALYYWRYVFYTYVCFEDKLLGIRVASLFGPTTSWYEGAMLRDAGMIFWKEG